MSVTSSWSGSYDASSSPSDSAAPTKPGNPGDFTGAAHTPVTRIGRFAFAADLGFAGALVLLLAAGMASQAGMTATTHPYYRSRYVFVSRAIFPGQEEESERNLEEHYLKHRRILLVMLAVPTAVSVTLNAPRS